MTYSQHWRDLVARSERFADPDKHLGELIASPGRLEAFSLSAAGLLYDFSRQRMDGKTLDLLHALAKASGAADRFRRMMGGEKVNQSDEEALRKYYRETITNGIFTEKGGAGLGFIEMSKITLQPLEYRFEPAGEGYSIFELKLFIHHDNV